MELLRGREASVAVGRRSGNSFARAHPCANVNDNGVGGNDVDQAVGVWLGAHAFLLPGELTRISWEW